MERLDELLDESLGAEKAKRWLNFKARLIGGNVELAPEPMLRADLISVVKRLTASGMTFDFPLTRDGRHADYAPACVLAVEKACSSVLWPYAMKRWREKDAGHGPIEAAVGGVRF